jgi:hypothetical protein
MSPAFPMIMAGLIAVLLWAIMDKRAFARRVDKRLAEEKVLAEKLTAFRTQQASQRVTGATSATAPSPNKDAEGPSRASEGP